MFTKGEMIKDLKNWGIRHSEKPGVGIVCLKQLKYEDVVKLWSDHKEKHPEALSIMDN